MILRSPHLLLASSNPHRMLANLSHILDPDACNRIRHEIDMNVKLLVDLGESHYAFAKQLSRQYWRQRVSRFYYGAYNVRRAINLHERGVFRMDVEDHRKIDLPSGLSNHSTYKIRLQELRDDRNLSDYDHTAAESDLLIAQDDAEQIVEGFISDSKIYLSKKGVSL